MLENQLRKIGLSDKEARVYLASLRLGKSPANDIAKQAGVNRATTYVIIESLIAKGLMTSFEQDDKAYFTAESPDRLLSLIKRQEQELRERDGDDYETNMIEIERSEEANADEMEQYMDDLSVTETLERSLEQVNEALERIESGTYGTCANCQGDIPVARLEAYPSAKRCTGCASKAA